MLKCYYIVINYTCFFCQKQCDNKSSKALKVFKITYSRCDAESFSIKEQLVGEY